MVTLKDIALQAGVNASTVSRALGDSREISDEMKRKIRDIARKLDYTPNAYARALVGKSSATIGLILPEVRSNYYARIANAIEHEFQKQGYSIVIGLTEFEYKHEVKSLEILGMRQVDGILLTGAMYAQTRKTLDRIRDGYRIPIVLLDAISRIKGYDHVVIDNRSSIATAVARCEESGIRTFGFIGDQIAHRGRLPRFRHALADRSLNLSKEATIITQERFEHGGYLGMKALLALPHPPQAVFAAYDNMAIGALRAVYESGLSVPRDIAVFGYDDIREGEYLFQPLTTIHAPVEEMARIGVNLITDRIGGSVHENQPVRSIHVKATAVFRDTTPKGRCGEYPS